MKILVSVESKKLEDVQTYTFMWVDNILTISGSSWCKPVKDLEDVFNSIKGFFHGTSYRITDIQQG